MSSPHLTIEKLPSLPPKNCPVYIPLPSKWQERLHGWSQNKWKKTLPECSGALPHEIIPITMAFKLQSFEQLNKIFQDIQNKTTWHITSYSSFYTNNIFISNTIKSLMELHKAVITFPSDTIIHDATYDYKNYCCLQK